MNLISRIEDKKLTLADKLIMHAEFLKYRGYFSLEPVGGDWKTFWDIWKTHKYDLDQSGMRVYKQAKKWRILYAPTLDANGIEVVRTEDGFEAYQQQVLL